MLNFAGQLNPVAIAIIVAIIGILIFAFASSVTVKRKYKVLAKDFGINKSFDNPKFDNEVLNNIVDDFRAAASKNPDTVNTQAIIEKNFNFDLKKLQLGERFVKKSVSLMIILGLLGTFYGLTLSIGKLVELLTLNGSGQALENVDSIVDGLINSVKGMSVAFVTSLFGIVSSVIITVTNVFYSVEDSRMELMVEIEEFLDNGLGKVLIKRPETELMKANERMQSAIDGFGEKVEKSFRDLAGEVGYRILTATDGIGQSAEALYGAVDKFDKSLNNFSENTRDFSEFNYHLKNNIQRMSLSFSDFSDDMKNNTDVLKDTVDALSVEISK